MNFESEFVHIGDSFISPIKQLINNLSAQDWVKDSSNQDTAETQGATESICLVWDSDYRHIDPTKLPALETFVDAIKPILGTIANYYERSDKWRPLFINNLTNVLRVRLVSFWR